MSSLARTRSVAAAVAWRGVHNAFTNPAFLLPSLMFPMFFFIAFAGGLSGVSKAPNFDFRSGYTAFQFVFVALQASAFGGVFTGFSIARDFESGFARRMLLAAPNRSGIVIGYMLSAMVRAVFVVSCVFAVGLATGMHVDGSLADLAALLAIVIATSATATLWGAGVAMRLRTLQAGPVIQMPVFILMFLAPVYVPLALVSGWVHSVASINPITALLNAGRALISGQAADLLLALGALAGLFALAVVWARGGLRSAERAG